MRTQLLGLTAALSVAALTASCGLTAPEPSQRPQTSGRITLGDRSRTTTSVSCTQNEWLLSIDATANPGRAHATLHLGGDKPTVQTINIDNIDGLHGVAGSGVGAVEASLNGQTYVITGTAVGSDAADPGRSTSLPFKIEAPC